MLTPGLQAGHPWQSWPISSCLQSQLTCGVQLPKGEEASATGGGINNWDMSMGTQWDGEYGPWEPFWDSIQGLVGIPWGASVVWKPCACGNNSTLWWVPVRDTGTQSCLDEADELRNSP